MEIPDDKISESIKFYEDTICSARFYEGTSEGVLHDKEASVLRGCFIRLGILTELENSQIIKRANSRVEKCKKRK